MINNVNYRITHKDNKIIEHVDKICFSYFYNNIRLLKTIEIFYFNKDIVNTPTVVSREDIIQYLQYLSEIGFIFQHEFDYEWNNEKCTRLFIDTKLNSKGSIKILLNSYRYCFEGSYPDIVQKFLFLCKTKVKDCNLFSKLIIAHNCTSNNYGGGHSFIIPQRYGLILTDDKVKELVLNNDNEQKCNTIFPMSSQVDSLYSEKKMFTFIEKEKNVNKIIKYYKELCEKYL